MKIIYTLIVSAIALNGIAQLKVVEPADLVTDINGHTVEIIDVPTSSDMEVDAFIINTSTNTLTLKCVRTEIDGLAGTTNATCWSICPPYLNTGSKVVYTANIGGNDLTETVAPGDTIKTFVGHYKPESLDGCSLFKYEWTDATSGTSYAEIFVRFIHLTTGVCTASIEDNTTASLKSYPNPANDQVSLEVANFNGNLEYSVSNLLGQEAISGQQVINEEGIIRLNVSSLTNGVYFASIKSNGVIVRTEKLVVKH